MADKLERCKACKARMVSKTMCEHGHERQGEVQSLASSKL